MEDIKTSDQNEKSKVTIIQSRSEAPLSRPGKIFAGTLLITGLFLSFWTIVAYWPDRLAPQESTTYTFQPFHVSLIIKAKSNVQVDTLKKLARDLKWTEEQLKILDELEKKTTEKIKKDGNTLNAALVNKPCSELYPCSTIQLTTLLLGLVAAAGFLGNMIYITSSFVAFVGINKFSRSWSLWYFTNPFTAAALALFIFFALNGANIASLTIANLFTIMAIAGTCGLFTKIATDKLRDFVEAVLKSSTDTPASVRNRTSNIDIKAPTIDEKNITPEILNANGKNVIQIPGTNLDASNLIIKLGGTEIKDAKVAPTRITFDFSILPTNPTDPTKPTIELLITDKANKELIKKTWNIK